MYDDINQRGTDIVIRTDSAPDRQQLQTRLQEVGTRWKNLKSQIDERQKSLGRLVPSVAGYMEVHEQVVTWLSESESKFDRLLSELGDVSDITEMAEKQEQLKVQNYTVYLTFSYCISVLRRKALFLAFLSNMAGYR